MTTRKPNWQAVVLAVALALWALWSSPSALVILIAYLVALVIVNVALPYLAPALASDGASGPRQKWIWLLILIVPCGVAMREIWNWSPGQRLSAARENLADRLALEQMPSIAPPLLVAWQPQRFFVHAPEGHVVSVQFSPDAPPLATQDLGHGVYLLDFDPREHSKLQEHESGELACTLFVDEQPYERTMLFARSLAHPRWLRSSPTAGVAATVSEETDELFVVRRDGSFDRVSVGDAPTDCALFDSGRKIAVAHRYSPELAIVDVATSKVLDRCKVPTGQVRLAVSPDEQQLAVAVAGLQPEIRLLNLVTLKTNASIPLSFSPDWLEFGRDASELVVTDLHGRALVRLRVPGEDSSDQAVDPLLGEPIPFPRSIVTMSRAADGKSLLLATTASFIGSRPVMANHFVENTLHRVDLNKWQVTATQVTDRRGVGQDGPGNLEHGTSPMGIASVGDHWLVAMAGSNEVAIVPASLDATSDSYPLHEQPIYAPHGVADLGEGVWAVSSPSDGTIGLFQQSGERRKLIELAVTKQGQPLSNPVDVARRRGEQAFYAGTRAGVACQSCHVHVDRDSGLFDIGQEMLVDVLSVRGVAGTSPYLRDASYWRLRDLHDVAREGYRGYTHDVPWDQAEVLATYMQHLPLVAHARQLQPPDLKRLRAGIDAFFKAQCVTCHTPPAMTNLGQHPNKLLFPSVGTEQEKRLGHETMLDTPSLRMVSQTAPYLHDGRAATLRAVLVDHNRENRHGNVKALTESQLSDLLFFLEQL